MAKNQGNRPLSPHVASWLGTFIAAGFQLVFSSRDEKNPKLAKRKFQSGAKMMILGPSIGLLLWRLLGGKSRTANVLPIVAASLVGSSFLKSEDEVESVNSVIWLRIASGIWSSAGRQQADFLTQLAIVATFYGVVNHTEIAPSILVKMTRRFLSPPIFDSVKNNDAKNHKPASQSAKDVVTVFLRTFRGLFAYNYFLHFSAAMVGHVVRLLGSKTVKGTKGKSTSTISSVLIQATKEATILNTAVSASCALLVAGSQIGNNLLGVLLVPLPLYFCAPRVRDTVYFLFIPWCVKYLFRLHKIGDTFFGRIRLLMGVYFLEGPLRAVSGDHEGFTWIISVAFAMAKSAGSGLL